MKSPTKGRKSTETPKAAPKRAKKKDTEGQIALTSEPLTMKNQRKRWGKGLNPKNPQSKQQTKQAKKKKKRKIKNLQTNYEEKETERGKEERTFKICSTNGKDAQNGSRSRVEVMAQVNRKKEGKRFSNRND